MIRPLAYGLGLLGLVGCIIGWSTAPQSFAASWLSAFSWFIGWPLGSVGLLLIHSLTGGRWGEAIRPALVAGTAAIILLLPFALPFALTASRLYPWLGHAAPAGKGFYLNTPFFTARCALYLATWCGLGVMTFRRLDNETALRRLAPIGLGLLAVTLTFAAIDTVEALDTGFNSSVYGLLTIAGNALLALSIAVLATALTAKLEPALWADLGRLLLGLVIFWAYLDFVQFLIVWESDLTAEIPWYLRRGAGLWGWLAGLVAAGHFVLPFALLLSGAAKRRRDVVIGVAGLLVAMEMLRAWWLVLPSLGGRIGWLDLAAMLAIAGLSLGWLIDRMSPPGIRKAIGDA